MKTLNGKIGSARLRLATARFVRTALRNAILVLLVLIVSALIALRAESPAWNATAAAVLISFFVLFTIVEGIARIPGKTTSALVLDRELRTHELFATALDMEAVPGEIPAEIRERAASAAADCDVDAAVRISIHPVLMALPVVLAAALLVVVAESGKRGDEAARLLAEKLDDAAVELGSAAGGTDEQIAAAVKETAEALKKGKVSTDRIEEIRRAVRVRIQSNEAILKVAAELEKLGMKGLEDAIRRGDPADASAAVSGSPGTEQDETTVREQLARLFDSIRDGDLRARLSRLDGVEDLAEIAGILADYIAAADAVALKEAGRSLESAVSQSKPAVAPEEIAVGPSAEIDIESIPLRYRPIVERYFSP